MVIGGYSLTDSGNTVTVMAHEAGWEFTLYDDAAEIFRCEWKIWQLKTADSFEDFIYAHDYNLLFQ